jgi:hypothetical protein
LKMAVSATLIRNLLLILMLISPFLSNKVSAQDLEPRRWNHLPTDQFIVGLGFSYTEAEIYFNPVWKITDGTTRLNRLGFGLMRTFDLAGKSARVSLLLPYTWGRWEGEVDKEFRVIHRRAMGDPRLRFSVNLYGAPALKGSEYSSYRGQHETNTVVGASIAVTLPLGQYVEDRLINIGKNRWSVRPQIGLVHNRGPWSFELTGSAFVFTDNKSFVENAVLKQDTMFAVQTHAIYTFRPGLWASVSTAYGVGGRIYIDNQKTKFEVDNWLLAAGFGFPISKTQNLNLTWVSGRTQNQVGRDSDNLLLSWSMRWINR